MDTSLENKLYQIEPVFFEEALACKDGEMNEMNTCMYFGCECGDGWFKPLEKFLKKVKIINDIAKNYNTKFVCEQLKEKYGELRVYYKTCLVNVEKNDKQINKQIDVLVDMFEDALKKVEDDCWNVCEWCGAEGGINGENLITTKGWISRICKKCAKEKAQRETNHYDQINKQKHVPRITWFQEGYEFLNPYYVRGFIYNNNYYQSVVQAFYCEKDKAHKSLYQEIIKDNKYNKAYVVEIIANEVYNIHMEESDYDLIKNIVKARYTDGFDKTIEIELLETKDKLLQNRGNHHNNIWGYCVCDKCKNKQHKDLYAKILMEVREELFKKNIPSVGDIGWRDNTYYIFDDKNDWKEIDFIQALRYIRDKNIKEEDIKAILF